MLKRLGDLCKRKNDIIDFILKARSSLPNNPSWQGWVTEYEVISILKLYGKLTVHNDVNGKRKPKELSCSKVIEMKENETLKPCKHYLANQWIIPFKWNQTFWDAIQILPRIVLGLRQITNAEMHVNKFRHLQSLLNATNPNGVEYLIICRRNNFEGFRSINLDFDEANWNIPVTLETVWYEELSEYDKDDEAPPFKKQKV